jgi:hypothetical protein
MQRLAKQASIAAADDGQKKWLHFAEAIRQLGRKRSIIVIQPPVTFLPGIRLPIPELVAKVVTDKRMNIEMPGIVRIFSREESCSS